MLALAVLAAAALPGCAGNGTQITDGQRCDAWLHGNGRDRYLAAHGLPEYDAGDTGRRPDTALQVGALMDQYCKDNPKLLIDEALRLSANPAAAAAAAKAPAAPKAPAASRAMTDAPPRQNKAKQP